MIDARNPHGLTRLPRNTCNVLRDSVEPLTFPLFHNMPDGPIAITR